MKKQANTENSKKISIQIPAQTESKNMHEAAIAFADVIHQFLNQTDDLNSADKTLALGKALNFLFKKQQPKLTKKKLARLFEESFAIACHYEAEITSVKG